MMHHLPDMKLIHFGGIATIPPKIGLRPFEVIDGRRGGIDSLDMDSVREALSSSATGEITPRLLSSLAKGQLVAPSKNAIDIELPGGDRETRITFVLGYAVETSSGRELTFIQGTTDRYDIDERYGVPTDETEFFINKIDTTLEILDDRGGPPRYKKAKSYEVSTNNFLGKRSKDSYDRLSRAGDLILDQTAKAMRSNAMNSTNRLQTDGKISDKEERIGANLFTKAFNSLSLAMDSNNGRSDLNTLFSSNSLVSTADSTSIAFIEVLDDMRDEIRTGRSTAPVSFSFGELREIFPSIGDDNSIIVESDGQGIEDFAYDQFGSEESDLMARDESAVIATDFMNVNIESSASYGIKGIGYMIHNFDTRRIGDVEIEILDEPVFFIPGISRDEQKRRVSGFLGEIKELYFLPLVDNGHREMSLTIFTSDDFEGKIIIDGDGFDMVQYPLSNSLTGMTTPILNSSSGFNRISEITETLINNI